MASVSIFPRASKNLLACRRGIRELYEYGVDAGDEVAIGLSGGPDSLALVIAARAEGHAVLALCVDHQLQEGSAQVAQEAARKAQAWGARAEVLPVEVVDRGEGVEAAARRARYQALAEAAGELPLLVAHTAEDQAETLLLAALRGKPSGMSIKGRSEGGVVYRPFLGVRRAHTTGTCMDCGVEFWLDPHNEQENFRRVALRKHVLPLLGEILGNGDATAVLAQAAGMVAEDNAYLESMVPQWAHHPGDLDVEAVAQLPVALARRAIRAWLHTHGEANPQWQVRVSSAAVADVLRLCTQWRGQGGVAVGKNLAAVAKGSTPESLGAARGVPRLVVVRVNGTLTVTTQKGH